MRTNNPLLSDYFSDAHAILPYVNVI